jgi:hypothetical protein
MRPDGKPYLRRWWVLPRSEKRWNIYLHNVVGDDEDRAMHDHPAWNISIVLKGGYWELTPEHPTIGVWRKRGSIVFRRAEQLHRLQLGTDGKPCWTLWISGVKSRKWGFMCPGGRWVDWKTFTGFRDSGAAYSGAQPTGGPGCGEYDDA